MMTITPKFVLSGQFNCFQKKNKAKIKLFFAQHPAII